MTKIAVLVGSLQQKSFNKMLAKNLEKVKPADIEFQYVDLNLPLYNQDLEANYPAEVQKQKDIVTRADGVLVVTPEYNRSLPGALKNALDWISRPYGDSAFAGKPAGVVGAGLHHVSGAIAQADFRHIAAFLDLRVMGQPEVHINSAAERFDEEGNMSEDDMRRLGEYMAAFSDWVDSQKK
ncbi:MAG TPA: NADPH-dependent FMN reductase [Candidatus Saccharimonadales bacterium]|nr:NADPH-dependent FMN reductase [Candidatus Saccharimonadales bacterium]